MPLTSTGGTKWQRGRSGCPTKIGTSLEFIGSDGKTLEHIEERFPAFDVLRVIRARLVEISRVETSGDVTAHAFEDLYVLTNRGAAAVGIDPDQLRVA
jgi:hypothetical protein